MPPPSISRTRAYFNHMQEVLDQIDTDAIDQFSDMMYEVWKQRRCVITFGNGGSAATASHHVCDYVKTAAVDGTRRLRALCLADNVAAFTAIANDIDYDDVFIYMLETYASPGDLLVAISCSGESSNVVKACRWGREQNLKIVALTGRSGGTVAQLADVHINIPSTECGVIEDLHMSIGHIVSQGLKARVTGT